MKVCRKCERELDDGEFYAGCNHCKECKRAAVRENRKANADYYRAYDYGRAMREDRVEARKQYAKTEAGKLSHHRAVQNYRRRYPERSRARAAVFRALQTGRLEREPCKVCGTEQKLEAHHGDYSQPLKVVWLCVDHHKAVHRKEIEVDE